MIEARRLRIILLAAGSSVHTIKWANGLAAEGVEIHLVSLHRSSPSLSSDVVLHRPPFRFSAGYLLNGWWMNQLVRIIKPDLVHAHYASGYGTLAALTLSSPKVLSVWGSDVYDFPQRSALHRWLIRFNMRRADRILSTSDTMAKHVGAFTKKPIGITPFGVDLSAFKAIEGERPFWQADVIIGTVKTLEKKYGIDYLLRAFQVLVARRPSLCLKCLIVGGGSEESTLKALCAELRIDHLVKFMGPVQHAMVPTWLNMLDVFVAVSIIDSESFGVAVVEAGACAKPVVVSDAGGLPEVVQDGLTGIVVRRKDVIQTADALETLVMNPELRRRMGNEGRARVARMYCWEHNVQQMIDIYRDVSRDRALTAARTGVA